MKKIVKRVVLGLTYLAVFSLILSYFSVWINPATLWFPAIFGLLYPYLLIVNIFFLLFWTWRKKQVAILIFVVLTLGYGHMKNNFQLAGKRHPIDGENASISDTSSLSLLSYNVRSFNYYEVSPVRKSHTFVIDLINQTGSGIICLQEILLQNAPGFSEKKLRNALLDYPFSHLAFNSPRGYSRKYGIGIFSKYMIIHRGEIRFEDTHNQCIFTDIKIGDDTVRIYNAHLQSLQLGSQNFKFITEFESAAEDEPFDEIQDISLIMKKAMVKRSAQAKVLSAHIHDSPYPVVVCGDFNDTPVSFVYHRIRKGLKDAFVEAGKGLGKTYSQIFPSYRIDYILFSKQMKAIHFNTIHADYSDHYPVSATLLIDSKR